MLFTQAPFPLAGACVMQCHRCPSPEALTLQSDSISFPGEATAASSWWSSWWGVTFQTLDRLFQAQRAGMQCSHQVAIISLAICHQVCFCCLPNCLIPGMHHSWQNPALLFFDFFHRVLTNKVVALHSFYRSLHCLVWICLFISCVRVAASGAGFMAIPWSEMVDELPASTSCILVRTSCAIAWAFLIVSIGLKYCDIICLQMQTHRSASISKSTLTDAGRGDEGMSAWCHLGLWWSLSCSM